MEGYLRLFTTEKELNEIHHNPRYVVAKGSKSRIWFSESGETFAEAYEKMIKSFYELIKDISDRNNLNGLEFGLCECKSEINNEGNHIVRGWAFCMPRSTLSHQALDTLPNKRSYFQ